MFISFDNGAHWQPFQLNLPNVPITDIKVHQKDLVVVDAGPGVLDPRQHHLAAPGQRRRSRRPSVHLYKPRDGYRTQVERARSGGRVLPAGRAGRAGDDRDSRCAGGRGEYLQQRSGRPAGGGGRGGRGGRGGGAPAADPDDPDAPMMAGRTPRRGERSGRARDEERRREPLHLGRAASSPACRRRPARIRRASRSARRR